MRRLFLLFALLIVALVQCTSDIPATPTPLAVSDTASVLDESDVTVVVLPEATNTNTPFPTTTSTATPSPSFTPTQTSTPVPTSQPTATPTSTPTLPPPSPTASPTPLPPTATPTSDPVAVAASELGGQQAQVINVVDGDTIDVLIDGVEYRVRYIGMDTPERGDTYYNEATQANAALVAGATVILVKDVSETDRFGRLLRYIYLTDGTFVNAELVRQGYAQVATFPPDVAHVNDYLALEQEARNASRGLWGLSVVVAPTNTPVPPPTNTPAPPPPTSESPSETATPPPQTGPIVSIITVDKVAEFVDIRNNTQQDISLDGWRLLSERGNQDCSLNGVLGAGQTLRIWAMSEDSGNGGFNCGFGSNIWNNSESDPAALYDAQGNLIDRRQ